MRIWDLSFTRPAAVLEGHPDVVYDVSCCSAESHLLATCGRKGVVILWDVRSRGEG